MGKSAAVLALGALVLCTAQSQVPSILNYQGRVTVGGTNLTTNAAQFKFALVNGDGTVVYWKNDGTTTTNEPSNAVTVAVAQGLYSTLLGDTALSNMAALPSTVFTNPNVSLRTWFSVGGTNAFVKLSPDQRLGSSGYALRAAAADSFNGRTNFPTDTTTFSFVADNASPGLVLPVGNAIAATFVQRPGVAITSCSVVFYQTGPVTGAISFYDATGVQAPNAGTTSLSSPQIFNTGASANTWTAYELTGLNIPSTASPRIVQIVVNASSAGSSRITLSSITVGFTPN